MQTDPPAARRSRSGRKHLVQIILPLVFCLVLSGCCLSHDWREADCTHPKTCATCGKTEGEALGHVWREANCSEPKTCRICGAAEGRALGHSWVAASCTEPEHCVICGQTRGDALGHQWLPANSERPKTCSRCGETEGEALKVRYFDMSPREYVDRFNETHSVGGQWMTFVVEGFRVNLYLGGEQMNIFLQFLDSTEDGITYYSCLDRDKWNKVKLYIATDDRRLDADYFGSFANWLHFLGTPLGLSLDTDDFLDKVENVGNGFYPEMVYTRDGIQYTLSFYDDSAGFGEPTTTYAASIELVQP